MGIEFRLSRTDHLIVENFLASGPSHVSGIIIDATNAKLQGAAIEAAKAAGISVLLEPLTERLADPGFSPGQLDYATQYPIDLDALKSPKLQRDFLERVLEVQLDTATMLVAPHFFVDGDDTLALNLDLAAATKELYGDRVPVRAIFSTRRSFLADQHFCTSVAARYAQTGVDAVDLRLSPLGSEADGSLKIRSALTIIRSFGKESFDLALGFQGMLGPACLAVGVINSFSVGIGYRERFDHAAAIARQRQPRKAGKGLRGALAGVFLPGAYATVSRKLAEALYDDSAIRGKLVCRLGECGKSIRGPIRDARGHFLHSRVDQVRRMLGQPSAWRWNLERDRIHRALELRRMVNEHHLPNGFSRFKTRGLESVLEVFGYESSSSAALA